MLPGAVIEQEKAAAAKPECTGHGVPETKRVAWQTPKQKRSQAKERGSSGKRN